MFTDALVKSVEYLFGVLQTTGTDVLAYEDAAIRAVVDAVAGLQHRAFAWQDGVGGDHPPMKALLAVGRFYYDGHFAFVLFAFNQLDGIAATGESGTDVFGRVTHMDAIDIDDSVYGFFLDSDSSEFYFHDPLR